MVSLKWFQQHLTQRTNARTKGPAAKKAKAGGNFGINDDNGKTFFKYYFFTEKFAFLCKNAKTVLKRFYALSSCLEWIAKEN